MLEHLPRGDAGCAGAPVHPRRLLAGDGQERLQLHRRRLPPGGGDDRARQLRPLSRPSPSIPSSPRSTAPSHGPSATSPGTAATRTGCTSPATRPADTSPPWPSPTTGRRPRASRQTSSRVAVPITGVFDCEPVPDITVNELVRLDRETARRLSPLRNPPRYVLPVLVAVGGAEPPLWVRDVEGLRDALPRARHRLRIHGAAGSRSLRHSVGPSAIRRVRSPRQCWRMMGL